MIPFNKAYISDKEIIYTTNSLKSRKLSGDGPYTKQATELLKNIVQAKKILLTTSCTDALEMTTLLLNIEHGDEIIIPAYTFVSTALAFEMRGAKIIFADSEEFRPHIDAKSIQSLITNKTRAIVPVHYAGEACDMGNIMKYANDKIKIIEDNAQGITSVYNNRSLGTLGTFGTLSFHDSKNIICGEGGAIIINDENYIERAEIIREKGTNRSQFFRGEIDKYGWADVGSSYLPSDILAAVLTAQLENLTFIQSERLKRFNRYVEELNVLSEYGVLTSKSSILSGGNGHIFYLVCNSLEERNNFIEYMKEAGILCVFHYLSLHKSKYFFNKYNGIELKNTDKFTDCLVRLPLYVDLTEDEQKYIINKVKEFFKIRKGVKNYGNKR